MTINAPLLRKFAKKMFEQLRQNRLYISRNSLPKGADLFGDLKRFGLSNGIRSLVDVGANVGEFTLNFLRHVPKCERVIAIEPEPDNFRQLTRRLPSSKSTCLQCAIGERETTGHLRPGNSNEMHSLGSGKSDGPSIEVQVRTLAEALASVPKEGIFLKTDTEGHDAEVLVGGRSLLESGEIAMVYSEVGFHSDDHQHSSFVEVSSILLGAGFDIFGFYQQSFYRRWHSLDHCNVLFLHASVAETYLPKSALEPWIY